MCVNTSNDTSGGGGGNKSSNSSPTTIETSYTPNDDPRTEGNPYNTPYTPPPPTTEQGKALEISSLTGNDYPTVDLTDDIPDPVTEIAPIEVASDSEANPWDVPIDLIDDAEKAAEKPTPAPTEYNQAYWADQRAKGVSQADMKVEQDKVGMKKAYSGDKVVTEDMSRKANDDLKRVTGSMAVIDDPDMSKADKADLTKAGILVGGVKKTEEKSGLFDRNVKTTYDYKGGPSIVTKSDDPTIGDVRLGEKTSTTFVDGIEVATKTGHDPLGKDAKVTKPDIAGHIDDTVNTNKKTETPAPSDSPSKQDTTPAPASALPPAEVEGLTNLLAIKKHKRRAGKRALRSLPPTTYGKNFGINVGGTGQSGLNIPT